jgi:hypothetical protein
MILVELDSVTIWGVRQLYMAPHIKEKIGGITFVPTFITQ